MKPRTGRWGFEVPAVVAVLGALAGVVLLVGAYGDVGPGLSAPPAGAAGTVYASSEPVTAAAMLASLPSTSPAASTAPAPAASTAPAPAASTAPAPATTTAPSGAFTPARPGLPGVGARPVSDPAAIEHRGPSDVGSQACRTNTHARLVLVSLRQQHAWMCERHHQVRSSAVTTGATDSGDATPTGSWLVEGKQADRYLNGPGYHDWVHYWIPYHGDFGIHDATWQTFPFGSPEYRAHGSHGCIHMPLPVMAWLYHWVTSGQTVVTVTK